MRPDLEELFLLRWLLPPLGLLMVIAGVGGWVVGEVEPLAPNARLRGQMYFQLLLLTRGRELPLSRLAWQSLEDCETEADIILQFLGQNPPETLLMRSYRHALGQQSPAGDARAALAKKPLAATECITLDPVRALVEW